MLDESEGDRWVFRRDRTIQGPLLLAVRRDPSGIPFFAPEMQLLYKARPVRAGDQADFDQVAPLLDPAAPHALGLGILWRAEIEPRVADFKASSCEPPGLGAQRGTLNSRRCSMTERCICSAAQPARVVRATPARAQLSPSASLARVRISRERPP